MRVIEKIKDMRTTLRSVRAGRAVVLVPTMGALHDGHLSLIRRARRMAGETGVVVVSIFVNPTQFSKGEDLLDYPRDFEQDAVLLREESVDILFHPEVGEMYQEGFDCRVEIGASALTEKLCGAARAGHFSGVATVVTKLFNIVSPDIAVFGQKDHQQQLVIKKLVKDLNMDIEIDVVETMRDKRGLAMSSRNAYLDAAASEAALCVPRSLDMACGLFSDGELSIKKIKQKMRAFIEKEVGLAAVEYISICDAESLEEATRAREGLLVAVAVKVSTMGTEAPNKAGGAVTALSVRLIDNCILDVKRDKITG